MALNQFPGSSLDLWRPDEEILATNINLRERKFGGFYLTSEVNPITLSPIFTVVPPGFQFGDFLFGFGQFGVSSFLTSTLNVSDIAPTVSIDPVGDTFNGSKFGFLSFEETQEAIQSSVNVDDLAPIIVSGTATDQFGTTDFGFLSFGNENTLVQDIVAAGDTVVSVATVNLAAQKTFGSFKFGFGMFDT